MKSLLIKRTFHPVGQGAFYTERHLVDGEPFNIVYDCGNRGCMSKVRPVVQDAFGEDEYVDVMFISHFDFDHVSLISDLKPYKNKRIRKVVLPLLYPNVRYALAGYYLSVVDRRIGIDLDRQIELILKPRNFFKDSEVCYVRPDEEFAVIDEGGHEGAQDADDAILGTLEETSNVVRSRDNIIEDGRDWALLPFNYDCKNRFIPLLKKLHEWLLLRNAKLEDLGKIEFVNARRRVLKSIYKQIGSGSNENSMLLYSGPSESGHCLDLLNVSIEHPACGIARCNRIGCIYTGDADLNLFDIRQVYNPYMTHVGTIQIPHHGSGNSFCSRHFPANARYCPVSYGTTNTYGHPDKTLKKQIASLCGIYWPVTEKRRTKLNEVVTGARIIINGF